MKPTKHEHRMARKTRNPHGLITEINVARTLADYRMELAKVATAKDTARPFPWATPEMIAKAIETYGGDDGK